MSKLIYIKNSSFVRAKLEEAGLKLCHCCTYKDAEWLDWNVLTKSVHGLGYDIYNEGSPSLTPEQVLAEVKKECGEWIECNSVAEFLDTIGYAPKQLTKE